MSRHAVYAFTEGFTDRYGYSRIIGPTCDLHGLSYEIVTAEEIPNNAGGKPALLAFFDYARRTKFLCDEFKGKRTVLAFFLDKDVDDFRRTKKRSRHLFYTTTYHFENLLFLNADLAGAAAAAASVDKALLTQAMGNAKGWCSRAAAVWQEWVEICAFSALKAEHAGAYYRRPISQINPSPYAPTDRTLYQRELQTLANRWPRGRASFQKEMNAIRNTVRKAYDGDAADRLFKGNWYCAFARADVEGVMGRRRWRTAGFEERLLCCLLASIDYDAAWAQDYRKQLDPLL
jgi:hypothetical protein